MNAARPPLGRRRWHHLTFGPTRNLPRGHSLLVVGPTQAGKTSSLVVPSILRWPGPVIVTSVKRDVVEMTAPWRGELGTITELRPSDGATWNPLETITSYRRATEVARDLVIGDKQRTSAEGEFWNALAVKLLAAVMYRRAETCGSIFDVVDDIAQRRFLDRVDDRDDDAGRILAAMHQHEGRTSDAITTTAEAMLAPWHVRQPLATLSGLRDGAHTLYLVAPRHDQRRYEGLFRGALRTVLDEQQARFEAGDRRELLLVLDEAATVAPLDDLDQLAATGSGLGITLVSVFQDFAQMEARYGDRAATIVNNHSSRLILGGLVDPRTVTYLPELAPTEGGNPTLRRWPRGTAALVSGRHPVATMRLVPWWKYRRLRRRVPTGDLTTMR